jgi:integrase
MKKPRYTHGFIDRHGRSRYYFRRLGFKQVPLPGLPWSPSFMAAYEAAMKGEAVPRKEIGESRSQPGTIAALVAAYFSSPQFKGLSASTQATYRGIIERFRREHGHRRIATLQRDKLAEMLGNRVATPTAANNWLRMVRLLMQFAIFMNMRGDDPTVGIKTLKVRSTGFLTWGQDQIAAYRKRHALGTKARLAFELLVNTGQRRSDVVRMGRQHIRDGILSLRQQKTGVVIEIPVLPEMQAALDAMPKSEHLTFLTTEYGKAFTAAGFGNWFRDRCKEAGLAKGYAAHGLRKAAATRHANSGATAHELMAWFGWTTLKEAERYTRAANRKQLAQAVMLKLATGTPSGKPD